MARETTWTFRKDRWFIQNKGVLADGRKASMLNVIKPVDQNSFTWQTVERTAGDDEVSSGTRYCECHQSRRFKTARCRSFDAATRKW